MRWFTGAAALLLGLRMATDGKVSAAIATGSSVGGSAG